MFYAQEYADDDKPSFEVQDATQSEILPKTTRKIPASKRREEDIEVVAWDMEGMNLSGDDKPQHSVIWGNSDDVEMPMVDRRLSSLEMLNYVIEKGVELPNALHVGYGFRYDANMLIRDLSVTVKELLWKRNFVKFWDNEGNEWCVSYVNGKKFTVTKFRGKRAKDKKTNKIATVTIYDYSAFFGGQSFLQACEQLLKDELTDDDREVIRHGKIERGHNTWSNISEVRHYWAKEILLIKRVFEKFRAVMFKAGFGLREWYGPGALANYINSTHKLLPHLTGAQVTSGHMPDEVHHASKVAFTGGRFELFQAGRMGGPVYAIDINSAYPYALSMIPSLAAGAGEWKHVSSVRDVRRFGFYRISYEVPDGAFIDPRPHPLFYRDERGMVSYPNRVHGWYASPEARMVFNLPGVTIHEGWVWESNEQEYPWRFLRDMYDTRMKLGKKNLMSMPFKLGPNSLYGKYAQTVGWNGKTYEPPRSHALPIAAWITSYTRSMLWSIIRQIPEHVIAVETDSVYTTVNPEELDLTVGDGLGEWGYDEYDGLVYIQSGMYHTAKGGEWNGVRSRGLHKAEFGIDAAREWLSSLMPGGTWDPLVLRTAPRFVGAGAAIARNNGMVDHCKWEIQEREIRFGETGKRQHIGKLCDACERGETPWDGPHRLYSISLSDGVTMSAERVLPWERAMSREVQKLREVSMVEDNLIATTG